MSVVWNQTKLDASGSAPVVHRKHSFLAQVANSSTTGYGASWEITNAQIALCVNDVTILANGALDGGSFKYVVFTVRDIVAVLDESIRILSNIGGFTTHIGIHELHISQQGNMVLFTGIASDSHKVMIGSIFVEGGRVVLQVGEEKGGQTIGRLYLIADQIQAQIVALSTI